MTRTLRPLAALAMIVLIAAGCSKSPDGTSTGSDTANYEKAVKFAACMRDNGLAAFPDPDASGDFGSGTGEGTTTWAKAVEVCKDLAPAGAVGGGKRTPEQQKTALRFAQCMRDNGIEDFPDPTADGPLIDTSRMPGSPGALSIPGFKDAQDTCGRIIADLLSGQK